MSAPRKIPDRPCAECRKLKRPRTWRAFHNPTWCCSRRCTAQRVYKAGQGAKMRVGTIRRAIREKRQRVEQAVGAQYGPLSRREIELFNLGRKHGYDEGYGIAYGRCLRKHQHVETNQTEAA